MSSMAGLDYLSTGGTPWVLEGREPRPTPFEDSGRATQSLLAFGV